ncbi:MAG: energy transducer TonB, partial [Bacteroidales bacterium]|nr:energy transducer TonB [Bacteroidales bacterium]
DVDDLFLSLEDDPRLGVEINNYYEEVEEEIIEEEAILINLVEEKPLFQGADANEFSKWVNKRIVYPEEAIQNHVEGRVLIGFTIEKDGKLTNIKVLRSSNNSLLDKEALRVVSTSPQWTPGKQRDRTVRVNYTFPVIFRLR